MVLVRTVESARYRRGAVELLVELTQGKGNGGVPPCPPLIAYRSEREWGMRTKEQAPQYLKSGLEKVSERLKEERRYTARGDCATLGEG